MIGDYVLFATRPYRVAGIAEGGFAVNLEGDGWKDIAALSGVPFTPEILEKNGFRPDGSGLNSYCLLSDWGEPGIRHNIYVGLKKKTIDVYAAHPALRTANWRKANKIYLEVCGCYVHELQHALKLCGIDKEITL